MTEGALIPGELLNPFEILGLLDADVKIVDIGIDGVVLDTEVGKILVWACVNCNGDESHLNYAHVETSDSGAA